MFTFSHLKLQLTCYIYPGLTNCVIMIEVGDMSTSSWSIANMLSGALGLRNSYFKIFNLFKSRIVQG